jgi:2-polyprenyl-3-methyl-5-hydroxy-6-metoxy-1,4-benzoquinol methylase
VIWLAKQGFQATGSDLSPSLLKIAKQKARRERVRVQFFQGDMRTQRINHFDAVITIFNAIGHLTNPDLKCQFIKSLLKTLSVSSGME